VRETSMVPADAALEVDPLPDGRLRLESAPRVAVVNANDLDGGAPAGPNWSLGPIRSGALGQFASWTVDPAALFEPTAWAIRKESRAQGVPAELRPDSDVLTILPMRPPFRSVIRIRMARPSIDSSLAVYREGDDGWEFAGADLDSATGMFSIQTRRLGRFAVFADTKAPRITALDPPRRAVRSDYSRWTLTARLVDEGAGVTAHETYFVVDGKRRPAEWDAVRNELRWRPLRAPARGTHRYEVVATDRAGNVARHSGTFVLD
jgi:hypothetical protein